MCGRYRLSRRKQIVEEYFDASGEEDCYNIAPTQPVPVIRQHRKEPRRVFSLMRWGLIPSWSKTHLELPDEKLALLFATGDRDGVEKILASS